MRVVVQRVKQASVSVEGAITGQIGAGLLALAGFEEADQPADLDWMAQKLVKLRVFPDEQGVIDEGKGSRLQWHYLKIKGINIIEMEMG